MESKIFKSAICRVNSIRRPNPSLFYFPGITSKPNWSLDNLKSAQILKANYNTILNEYKTQRRTLRLENDYKLIDKEKSLHTGDWHWHSLIAKGVRAGSTPFAETLSILNSLDDLLTGVPLAYSFFSSLAPNSSIQEHYGPSNIRLRMHLGLEIPDSDCSMSLAGETLTWEQGKCLVFDDSYIHSVRNDSKHSRLILLVDIWHPEIEPAERKAIVSMFQGASERGWLKH